MGITQAVQQFDQNISDDLLKDKWYSKAMLRFILEKEGNASVGKKTDKTTSDWGPYTDGYGHLTTGIGLKVSDANSKDVEGDIKRFQTQYGIKDIYSMTFEEAINSKVKYLDKHAKDFYNAYTELKDIDPSKINKKLAMVALDSSFNMGPAFLKKKMKNGNPIVDAKYAAEYLKNFKNAALFDSASNMDAFAKTVDDYWTRGNTQLKPDKGLIKRNKERADILRGVYKSNIKFSPNVTPYFVSNDGVSDDVERSPAGFSEEAPQDPKQMTDDELQAYLQRDRRGREFMAPTFSEREAAKEAVRQRELDKPLLERAEEFRNHLGNSLLVENIVGSTVAKYAAGGYKDYEYDPNFEPTKMPLYNELMKGVDPEDVVSLLKEVGSEREFHDKVTSYKIEKETRAEMADYFSRNPVKGFVGVGIASMVDVTSLIPVSKIASATRVGRLLNTAPSLLRNVVYGVGENLVQDMTQELALTSNSNIRKWDDGDIMYGAVFSAMMGGVSGSFKHLSDSSKIKKLSDKYTIEKDLDSLLFLKERVKSEGYSSSVSGNVNRRIEMLQADIDRGVRALEEQASNQRASVAFTEALEHQRSAGAGILEYERMKALKHQAAMEVDAVDRIEAIKSRLIKEVPDRTERQKLIRRIQSEGANFKHPEIDAIEREIVSSRDHHVARLNRLEKQVAAMEHPVQQQIMNDVLEQIPSLSSVNLKHLNTQDKLDEFLGLKFDDSASAARTSKENMKNYSDFEDRQHISNFTDDLSPELNQVLRTNLEEARKNPTVGMSTHAVLKDSAYAKTLRATKLANFLTTESLMGRMILNKNSLRHGQNPFAAALYNVLAPDGAGRVGQGKLSMFERMAMLKNIYNGPVRQFIAASTDQISELAKKNPELAKDLKLSGNPFNDFLRKFDREYQTKISNLVREEYVNAGSSRVKYGEEAGKVIEDMLNKMTETNGQILDKAMQSGVEGVSEFYNKAKKEGRYLHRSWNHKLIRQMDKDFGSGHLQDAIRDGFLRKLTENGVELTEDIAKEIDKKSGEFLLGIREGDLAEDIDRFANITDYLNELLRKNEEITTGKIESEVKRITDNKLAAERKELGKRVEIDLNGSFTKDGVTVRLADMLSSNLFEVQEGYTKRMSARIAAAENGFKNIDDLDVLKNKAIAFERQSGDLTQMDYIEDALNQDISAFKRGGDTASVKVQNGTKGYLGLLQKYQFTRLLHYTGFSAIGEMGRMIPQAGYRAVGESVAPNIKNYVHNMLLSNVRGKHLTDHLTDELTKLTGIGFEDIHFDPQLSAENRVLSGRIGQFIEGSLDNLSKVTRRTSSHIERVARTMTINALGVDMFNVAMNRTRLGSMAGGLSRQNLVEFGLADIINGKAVTNQKWNRIVEHVNKYMLDVDGKLASETGNPVKNPQFDKWDTEVREDMAKALVQWSNHILVNPDPTTAKAWNASFMGSILNQFRTFSNNAASKVAGHNLNQALQGFKRGELAELSKTAQSFFWSAIMGKLGYAIYGVVNESGREDFDDRVEKYLSIDDPRDWTRALGRSSLVSGFDGIVDTGVGVYGLLAEEDVDPFFDYSTVGRSRNALDLNSTPMGQTLQDTQNLGKFVLSGDTKKASKTALKMAPFRKALGVNQMLNAMGID